MARSDEFVLAAHWDFHEGSGTTLGDIVGSNDGTIINGPTWLDIGGGKYALHFGDNAEERVTFPTKMEVANETATDPWEYIAYNWLVKIQFRTTVKSGRVLWQRNVLTYTDEPDPAIWIGTDGILRAVFAHSGYPNYTPSQVSSGIDVTDGQWHEVAVFQCEGAGASDTGHLWLDGNYIGYVSNVSQGSTDAVFWLGAGILASSEWGQPFANSDADAQTDSWSGDVRDIKVWWWNGVTDACPLGAAAVDDLLEYQPGGVANAIMFSCNT